MKRIVHIITTGGTGFSPRDITPEATSGVIGRPTPGIDETIRDLGRRFNPRAALSRGVSGIRGRTLIVNLPGSPRAIRETLHHVLPVLAHGLEVLRGRVSDCAPPEDSYYSRPPVDQSLPMHSASEEEERERKFSR